jgi:hypothetical protein
MDIEQEIEYHKNQGKKQDENKKKKEIKKKKET